MSAQPIEVKESSLMVPEQCSSEIDETGSAAGSALEQSIGTVTALSSQRHKIQSDRPDVTRSRTMLVCQKVDLRLHHPNSWLTANI